MESHQDVNFFESHAISGNSLVNNKEIYLDKNILTLNLTGVYTLNGWVDVIPNKLYPRFTSLGTHTM